MYPGNLSILHYKAYPGRDFIYLQKKLLNDRSYKETGEQANESGSQNADKEAPSD